MDKDIQREIRKIIDRIEKESADSDYIYRGEPKRYKKVTSSLYRQYAKEIEAEYFDIEVVQAEMLTEAKHYVYEKDGFEILTQLQHYGGKTNLIDFTNDYLIALFFACDGFPSNGGRVILLEKNEMIKDYINEPQSPINRVRDQKSVFVQPPKGFIEQEQYKTINIPKHLKQSMLDHLEKYHGISANVIYNDLHGFIRVQDLHRSAYTEFFKGWTCQNRKEYDKAIDHYTEALNLNPQLVTAYLNRGNIYDSKRDYNRAINNFNKVIEMSPDFAEAYNNRGNTYKNKGDYDRAIDDFSKTIALNPDDANAYNNRGNVHNRKGDYECAIVDYTQAIKLDPNHAAAYLNRGNAHNNKRDFDQAIADYTQAVKLEPNDANGYNNRGAAYNRKGDYDRAIVDCTQVIQFKPNDASAYLNRGDVYNNKRDFDQAIADYTQAIKLNPNDANAYFKRGLVHLTKSSYERAIVDFDRAIEIKPNYVIAYVFRAFAHYVFFVLSLNKRGEFASAIENCNRVIELDPQNRRAHDLLDKAQRGLEKSKEFS